MLLTPKTMLAASDVTQMCFVLTLLVVKDKPLKHNMRSDSDRVTSEVQINYNLTIRLQL